MAAAEPRVMGDGRWLSAMLEIAEHYLPFAALSRLHADQPLHAVCRRRDTCGSVAVAACCSLTFRYAVKQQVAC
jgi:hypothetical protein